jgi:hypothetical protein
VVVGVEGEAEDFVEGAEEAEGDTTMTEGEEVVVGGAEVEEAEEEGAVVCVVVAAEEELISQTLPLLVATGSALILSKSVLQVEQNMLQLKSYMYFKSGPKESISRHITCSTNLSSIVA